MRVILHLDRPPNSAGHLIAVENGPFVIGRSHDADLRANHPAVSRRHCALVDQDGRPVVHDLGSSNGTHVNGERVTEPRELRDGDRLNAGPLQLTVHVPPTYPKRKSNPRRRS